jgi:hypothetical protein
MAHLRKDPSTGHLIKHTSNGHLSLGCEETPVDYYFLQQCGTTDCSPYVGVSADDVTGSGVTIFWSGLCWTLCNPTSAVPSILLDPDDFAEIADCDEAQCSDPPCDCPCGDLACAPESWALYFIGVTISGCCIIDPNTPNRFAGSSTGSSIPSKCWTKSVAGAIALATPTVEHYQESALFAQDVSCTAPRHVESDTTVAVYASCDSLDRMNIVVQSSGSPRRRGQFFYGLGGDCTLCEPIILSNQLTQCEYNAIDGYYTLGHGGICLAIPCCT